MFRSGRKLSYANVAATLALFFSMSGGALAASHYLINSTRQINPKVLKALKGKKGATGLTGTTGATGATGATGKEGPAGKEGKEGKEGQSALSPLPAGHSESGEFDQRTDNTATGLYVDEALTFPIPLAAPIPVGHVIYTAASSPKPHCTGPGHAEAGYVCIYSGFRLGYAEPAAFFNYETGVYREGASRLGFDIEWTATTADGYDDGTYTVTAE
jgi:hypothetical protein